MCTAAVFLDVEKTFEANWHPVLLCINFSELHFSAAIIKLISSFLPNRTELRSKAKFPRPGKCKQGCHKVPSCPLHLQLVYKRYPPNPMGPIPLFADDTCLYAMDRKEGYVLRKMQCCLTSMVSWCERCNIKINGNKTQTIYFFHRRKPVEARFTMNGWIIPFVNHVKYLGVISDKRITWWLHRVYPLFRSRRLSSNIKLTRHKALARAVMIWACPAWEFAADAYLLKLQHLQNKVLRIIGNFPRRTPTRELHVAFNIQHAYNFVTQLSRQQAKVIPKSCECNCSQHRTRRSYTQKCHTVKQDGKAWTEMDLVKSCPWALIEHHAMK